MSEPRLLSTAEAAAVLGVSKVTMLSYMHRGLLSAHRARRGFCFEETLVLELRDQLRAEASRWINLVEAAEISGLAEYWIKRGVATGRVRSRSAPRNLPTVDRESVLRYARELKKTPPSPRQLRPPKPPEQPGQWLNTDETAALLGVSRQRVGQLARAGRLPATRQGRFWWFRRDLLGQRPGMRRQPGARA